MQVLDGYPSELPVEAQGLVTMKGKSCITMLDFFLFSFIKKKKNLALSISGVKEEEIILLQIMCALLSF